MERRSRTMLILALALVLAVPPLALVWSGVVQAQAVGNSWASRASMSTARYGLGLAAASNGKLYAVGGYDGSHNVATLDVYDPTSNTWGSGTSMPIAQSGAGFFVAASNGKLYAVNGGSTLEYDPTANSWTSRLGMPTSRVLLGVAAASDGKLYAVGGYSGGSVVATVEAYDPVTNTWASRASMPTARGYPGLAAVGNKLYAVGGTTSGGTALATVEAYDPVTNTWASRAPVFPSKIPVLRAS